MSRERRISGDEEITLAPNVGLVEEVESAPEEEVFEDSFDEFADVAERDHPADEADEPVRRSVRGGAELPRLERGCSAGESRVPARLRAGRRPAVGRRSPSLSQRDSPSPVPEEQHSLLDEMRNELAKVKEELRRRNHRDMSPKTIAAASATAASKRTLPTLKLGTYDGTTPIETFLAKFENCSDYYEWSERERLHHLKASLEKDAGQVLWDSVSYTTVADVIKLLKNRFGGDSQCERYRAELRSIKRKKNDTVQTVYQEIRRLMALAFPGQGGPLWETLARDAFLDALGDIDMRRRVLERDPATLDEAMKLVCRLEAIDRPVSASPTDEWSERGRRSNRFVRFAAHENDGGRLEQLELLVENYKRELDDSRIEIQRLRQEQRPPPAAPQQSVAATDGNVNNKPLTVTQEQSVGDTPSTNNIRRRQRPVNNNCFGCQQPGHRLKECPLANSAVRRTEADAEPTEVYMEIDVCGKRCPCLLDTGCEKSIMPRRLVPTAHLHQADNTIKAANGSEIPILGSMRLAFTLAGMPLYADFLVTDSIDEVMLGVDWLAANDCVWRLGDCYVTIRGRKVRLKSRRSIAFCRRVCTEETLLVEPGTQVNVPVRITWNSLRAPSADWLIEPKVFRKGVFSARTLLPRDRNFAAVNVINTSPHPCKIKLGQVLGQATPVFNTVCANHAPNNDSSESAFARCRVTEVVENDDTGYLKPVFESLPAELSDNERDEANRFILNYAHVFSKHEYDLGRTHIIPHRIDTCENKPFRQALRRHPRVHEEYIDKKVDEMLRNDIIEPASSPWASNVCLAKRADGELRFCVDYRQLNELTCKISYPLPRISSCLDALGGSRYFSTLDLRSGFWQTALDGRDADKTAFVTRKGQFKFKVLSFGLVNAPSQFQRIIDLVLAGLSWEVCLAYVDDVIVMSSTFEQHMERLSLVFQRLSDAGLKLKPNKCKLFQLKVHFLGHIVSGRGLEPDSGKVASVANWPVPKDIGELRSWLGLASYYRSFIKDLSVIASPLFALLKKGTRFIWSESCQRAFESVKNRLISAPVLATPMDGGGYVLDCDACDSGLGAVLQQYQEGELRVIAYASRTLMPPERNYCTTRKEQLAVVYGLRQFRPYILAHHTVVRSDHAALSYLKRAKEPVGQQARWLDFIEQFDLELQYRRGSSHSNADSLSRRPCDRPDERCKQCMGPKRRTDSDGETALSTESIHTARAVHTRQQSRQQHATAGVDIATETTATFNCRDRSGRDGDKLSAGSENFGRTDAEAPYFQEETIVKNVDDAVLSGPEASSHRHHRPVDVEATEIEGQVGSEIPDPTAARRQGVEQQPGIHNRGDTRDSVGSSPTVADLDQQWTVDFLAGLQAADSDVSVVRQWKKQQQDCPSRDALKPFSQEVKTLVAQWESLVIVNDILYRRFERPEGDVLFYQLVAPRAIRRRLLERIHAEAAGHLAFKKTAEQLQRRAYWSTWKTDAEIFCKNCDACNRFHRGKLPKRGFLQDMRTGLPFERLHIDLTGPHVKSNGFQYTCTCICAFTKYVIAWPIRDKKATTVARGIVERVFLPFGVCSSLLTDNGKEFDNEIWREICRILGIVKHHTTPYFPACNGVAERWHRSMNAMIGKTVQSHQRDWPQRLPYVVSAYNSSVHESTGYSPNFLMFGRELQMAVDITLGNPSGPPYSVNEYAEHLIGIMAMAYEDVRGHLGRAATRNKNAYDYGVMVKDYQPGDRVWYYSPRCAKGRSPKWNRCYDGPYEVIRKVNTVNFTIRKSPRSAAFVVHVNKLKPYNEPGLGQ